MLIDKKDGDVGALSVLAECIFNALDFRLWVIHLFLLATSEGDCVLGSTIKKFFWSGVTCPIPASRRPVIVS